jgi:hypothetical protein
LAAVTAAAIAITASWRLLSPPEPAGPGSEIPALTDSALTGISVLILQTQLPIDFHHAHGMKSFRATSYSNRLRYTELISM